MRKYAFLLLLSTSLYSTEPSAYGAGDLNSPTPYGLTDEEKVLLQTKKHLQKVEVQTNTQANKVNSLRERIDGLQSVVEGLAKNSHKNRVELQNLKKLFQQNQITSDEYQQRVEKLLTQQDDIIKQLQQNVDSISQSLATKYVTKEELQIVIDNFNKFKKVVASSLKVTHPLDKKSKAQVLKEANRLYKKRYYTKAIGYYKYLLEHHYKPAYSSYMLGEIYYKKKNYAYALAYYKESAKRYAKASYMPTLLLHSALSMEKTGDHQNAQRFFQAVVAKYPSSPEAKIAKKYIK